MKHATLMKFGGSSVASADLIRQVGNIIRRGSLKRRTLVVVSAVGKTTNELLAAGDLALEEKVVDIADLETRHLDVCEELGVDPQSIQDIKCLFTGLKNLLQGIVLIGDIDDRISDVLMSFGERLSVRILAAYLRTTGVNAKAFDSWDLGLRTSSGAGGQKGAGAVVLESSLTDMKEALASVDHKSAGGVVPVITGFIAKDTHGKITTFGRNGSDYTAALVGAAVEASEIQIWTDVDGILTAEPKLVPDARCIAHLSFLEASEMAHFGAKVLHPKTIGPAMRRNIPIRVCNTRNPDFAGTVVSKNKQMSGPGMVTALTSVVGSTIIDIQSGRMLGAHGFLARVFGICDHMEIPIDVISTSEISVSLTVDSNVTSEKIQDVVSQLRTFATVTCHPNKAVLSIIGDTSRACEILAATCRVLHTIGVSVAMVSCGASKVNTSLVIDDADSGPAITALHKEFFPPENSSDV